MEICVLFIVFLVAWSREMGFSVRGSMPQKKKTFRMAIKLMGAFDIIQSFKILRGEY